MTEQTSGRPVPVSIPSPRGNLFGMLHRAEKSGIAVVMCPPFAEEKKTSYRTLYKQAGALAGAGVPVLRFDYSGTGDSPGVFEDGDLGVWADDIRAASEFVLNETGAEELCLLGLRLGGTLALTCRSNYLVLWQPMMDPGTYLTANVRRQSVRHKLISGGSGDAPGAEMDGYPISDRLSRSMNEATPEVNHDDCFLVQISYTEKILAEYSPWRDKPGVEFAALRMEPFWNRMGRVDVRPLIELTSDWVLAKTGP